ncbi:MAG: T9SS type A sorting domain-containing protein [Bacteroidales bacterium]|nr:T9SS type A sorting domain-containing protein [Bacteroidales bacterium]
MKRFLTSLSVLLFVSLSLFSQGFISEGRQWNVQLSGWGYSTEVFRISGDSLVEGTLYKKMLVSYDSLSTWSLAGLLRAEDDRVFYMQPDYDEGLLYDFSLQAGESALVRNFFCLSEDVPVTVLAIDTVEYMGVERKRWLLGEDDWVYDIWVEGIGSLSGPLYTRYEYCIICPVWELLCAYQSESKIYENLSYETCYINFVGIDESPLGPEIQLFPNPVIRGQKVQLHPATAGSLLSLYSTTGTLMAQYVINETQTLEIETERLAPGLYTILITSLNKQNHRLKLLVQ